MTSLKKTSTETSLLKHATFEPVFDRDGNIAGIRELKVEGDRRNGVKAMEELHETSKPGDDVILATGWTAKQARILRQRAPLAAHYLKTAKKWDARLGDMTDGVLLLIPYEVVWTLFERLFEGQYSIDVTELVHESEEISPVGNDHQNKAADDAPGRIFFARAQVKITLHLAGGANTRSYEGVGVSYSEIPMGKAGNVFAVNSAHRTAEKGAVVDAKREAISNIGPVFRRAFDDGDEMIEYIESLLMEEIQERNKPAIHRAKTPEKTVPAPERKKPSASSTDDTSQEKTPRDENVTISIPNAPDRKVSTDSLPGSFVDIIMETCDSRNAVDALVSANSDIFEKIKSSAEVAEAISFFDDNSQPEDEIPDFDVPGAETNSANEDAAGQAENVPVVDTDGKTRKAVCEDLISRLRKSRNEKDWNTTIAANGAAIRMLTPKMLSRVQDTKP